MQPSKAQTDSTADLPIVSTYSEPGSGGWTMDKRRLIGGAWLLVSALIIGGVTWFVTSLMNHETRIVVLEVQRSNSETSQLEFRRTLERMEEKIDQLRGQRNIP